MKKEEIKALSKDLLTVKKGGFFVFYIDKSSPGITGGNTLFISKKMSAGMAEFKKSKKKDPKVVRGAIQFDDEYNENGDTGIILTVDENSGNWRLRYTSTNTVTGTINYSVEHIN